MGLTILHYYAARVTVAILYLWLVIRHYKQSCKNKSDWNPKHRKKVRSLIKLELIQSFLSIYFAGNGYSKPFRYKFCFSKVQFCFYFHSTKGIRLLLTVEKNICPLLVKGLKNHFQEFETFCVVLHQTHFHLKNL